VVRLLVRVFVANRNAGDSISLIFHLILKMKNVFTLLLLTALIACNSETKKATPTAASTTEKKVEAPAPVAVPTIDASCFVHALKKDSTFVQLVITGDNVTGKMTWQPYQKDGARGTLKGKKVGDVITVDYDYMIEGNQQMEEKVFILRGDSLLVKSGELTDKNGKLVLKNLAKATVRQTLVKADCRKVAF
jgi:hypothetical protein